MARMQQIPYQIHQQRQTIYPSLLNRVTLPLPYYNYPLLFRNLAPTLQKPPLVLRQKKVRKGVSVRRTESGLWKFNYDIRVFPQVTEKMDIKRTYTPGPSSVVKWNQDTKDYTERSDVLLPYNPNPHPLLKKLTAY